MSAIDREAIASGAAGAVLGGMAGSAFGSARLGAMAGGLHGWIAGRRRIYELRRRQGLVAFVLDHTWALATTLAGTMVLGACEIRVRLTGSGPDFDDGLSCRRNRFVYRRGVVLRRGFALTVGTVITGAGDRHGELPDRRRRLVDDHEDVHVWQARLLGPLYPVSYAVWFAGGAVIALVRRLGRGSARPVISEIDALAYYCNPFEWHAYTCADNWPPAGVDPDSVWSDRCPIAERMPRVLRESAGIPAVPRRTRPASPVGSSDLLRE